MPDIEFSLLENGLDFLLSAAEYSTRGDPRSLKYAVLHLDAAIELALKACLVKEHWSLLFANVDKANIGAMKSGEFVSVDLDSLLSRLRGAAKVHLTDDNEKKIRALHDLRNRIQHFAVRVKAETVKALLAFGSNFVLEFCSGQLSEDIDAHQQMFSEVKEELVGFKEFVDERMAALRGQIEAAGDAVNWCPDCNQDTLVMGNGKEPYCIFCGEAKPTRAVAELITETEVWTCPKCGEEALTLILLSNEEATHYCVFCGFSGQCHECPRCGQMYSGGGAICENCWDAILSKDD